MDGTSQIGVSQVVDPGQDQYYQAAHEQYMPPEEQYDQPQQFKEPHHEEEAEAEQHGALEALPVPDSFPMAPSHLSFISPFAAHVPCKLWSDIEVSLVVCF